MTINAPKPPNEAQRLDALRLLGLLDTPPEERFDRFTRLARRVFQVPIAAISLVDEHRQWFKSKLGLDTAETPRDSSFCAHAILEDQGLIIPDVAADERFVDNPLVRGEPNVRFYAGFPIRLHNGLLVGTLCLMDSVPRTFTENDLQLLVDLARMVDDELALHNLATVDELTGLSNRRGFLNIGEHAIAMCRRMHRPATLMFFDLDGFKAVNDSHGHAEGDRVLQEIGQILLREFRHSDVIARLGGDEFCVLLTGTPATDVNRPLANLQRAVDEENANNEYHIGYSVGTVSFEEGAHTTIHELLAEADRRMYERKRAKTGGSRS
ncbi:MAG: GGDEF domain-containing protein [Pseudomonadota bacterium]